MSESLARGHELGTTDRTRGASYGLWGMLVLIASEGTLFAAFIGTYFFLRFDTTAWPPRGDPRPALVAPLVLTAILVATSVPLWLAARAARSDRLSAARRLVLLALVVQVGYLAYQLHDFHDQLRRLPFTRDAYSSISYTLLGADHAHVLLGILFNLWLLGKLAGGLTTYRVRATQAIAWYWYFVSAATVVVTATLISGRM